MINIIGGTIIRTIMKRDLEKGKLLKIDLNNIDKFILQFPFIVVLVTCFSQSTVKQDHDKYP